MEFGFFSVFACVWFKQTAGDSPNSGAGDGFTALPHLTLYVLNFFFVLLNMYSLPAASAALTASVSAASAGATGKDKLEARLLALLSAEGTTPVILDKLGDGGLTTMSIFASIEDDKTDFRKLIINDIFGGPLTTLANKLQLAHIMTVYKACLAHEEVALKQATERRANKQAPNITEEDIDICWKLFENKYHQLTKTMCPSPAYFARKEGEIESCWKAEPLTRVTNYDQDDINNSVNMGWDTNNPQAPFKLQKKEYGVPMPQGPEELRARWRTLAVCFMFAKLRHPEKSVLRTADMEMFNRYTEWMFGKDVWGLVTKNEDGKVIATPHIGHVRTLDYAIRSKVAELMTPASTSRRPTRRSPRTRGSSGSTS